MVRTLSKKRGTSKKSERKSPPPKAQQSNPPSEVPQSSQPLEAVQSSPSKKWNPGRIVALVLLMVAFGVLLGDRVGLAADLLTWDSHNALGWSVFYTSVAAMVFILLSALVLVVCAFFKGNKPE